MISSTTPWPQLDIRLSTLIVVCVCVHAYICVYLYTYICIYVYMYIYIYVYNPPAPGPNLEIVILEMSNVGPPKASSFGDLSPPCRILLQIDLEL